MACLQNKWQELGGQQPASRSPASIPGPTSTRVRIDCKLAATPVTRPGKLTSGAPHAAVIARVAPESQTLPETHHSVRMASCANRACRREELENASVVLSRGPDFSDRLGSRAGSGTRGGAAARAARGHLRHRPSHLPGASGSSRPQRRHHRPRDLRGSRGRAGGRRFQRGRPGRRRAPDLLRDLPRVPDGRELSVLPPEGDGRRCAGGHAGVLGGARRAASEGPGLAQRRPRRAHRAACDRHARRCARAGQERRHGRGLRRRSRSAA